MKDLAWYLADLAFWLSLPFLCVIVVTVGAAFFDRSADEGTV